MWKSLFKLVLEVIDAEKILEPDINRNVKFMPFLYHGSHLGFQGIIEREKMAPYFFLCLYHILTESGEFLLLPKKIHECVFHDK